MAGVVGIEVTADAVRGVVVDPATRRVLRTAEVAMEGAPPGQALRALRGKLRPGGAEAAVTADLGTVISRVTLPFSDPRRLAEVAAFQVEERVPFDVTDWTTDHLVARRLENGAELLVFAARRRDVEDLMEALLAAGIYPAAVVPRVAALAGLLDGAEGAVVWVDAAEADVAVCSGAGLALARVVPLPEEGEEAAAREARVALLAAGASTDGCPTYAGGRAPAAGRVQELLAARPLDALLDGQPSSTWAPAAGAALSLGASQRVDLAHAMRGPALTARGASRAVTVFLVVAVILGAAFLAQQVRGALAAGRAAREGRDALRSVWQALYPGEAMPPDVRQRILSDLAAATGQQAGGPARVDALPRLRSAVEALPTDAGLKVTGFRIGKDALVVSCSAGSLAAADKTVAALQAALPATVSQQNPQSLGSGEYAFDIQVRWKQAGEGGADG